MIERGNRKDTQKKSSRRYLHIYLSIRNVSFYKNKTQIFK
jgi:hypothetical protein